MQHISNRLPKINLSDTNAKRRWQDILLLIFCRPDRLISIGWWRLCGKKLRARYRLDDAIAQLPFAHERWMERCGQRDLAAVTAQDAQGLSAAICVHLHISLTDDPRMVRKAINACLTQSVPPAHLIVTGEGDGRDAGALRAGVTPLQGSYASRLEGLHSALQWASDEGVAWVVPIASDTRLPHHAIASYAAHLLRVSGDCQQAVLYGDEDEISPAWKSANAWLKPEWDPRMCLSQDYISRACALRVEPALQEYEADGRQSPTSLYELLLRVADGAGEKQVQHLQRVTARVEAGVWHKQGPKTLELVRKFATEASEMVLDEVTRGPFGTVQVQWALPDPGPSVSIIVPTRDRVELLRTCVEGVLQATDYPNFELIIADNDSCEPETLAYMDALADDPRVRIVRWPHPFNYSAINNFAAAQASGEYLCLLNNDIEVIEPQWLTELVREAVQPGVGAVGARLLYPDRSIQHAGVAIGIGNAAGHAHRGLPEGEAGYYAQALIARGASAVTAACLLVAKEHFDAVGGLDEEAFAVAYNDVDLCLKLRELGLTNIYTPAATLIHHESKSRGLDFAPEHLERYMRELASFQERWDTKRVVDPWHHPQLDRSSEVHRS